MKVILYATNKIQTEKKKNDKYDGTKALYRIPMT